MNKMVRSYLWVMGRPSGRKLSTITSAFPHSGVKFLLWQTATAEPDHVCPGTLREVAT